MAVSESDERTEVSDERDIRPIDFSQPTKFTPELRRRLTSAVEAFGGAVAGELCEQLGCEVTLTVEEARQLTWAAARAHLPADALAVAACSPNPARALMLSLEQPLLLGALECMLGGQASDSPPKRHLSEVDWRLLEDLLDGFVTILSGTWQEIGGTALKRGELDLEGDAGLTVAPSEPSFVLSLKVALGEPSFELSVLIPWTIAAPLAHLEGAAGASAEAGAAPVSQELRRGLSEAQVLLRAEVGAVQMPVERMLALAPGTVVELQERAEDGVLLFAEEVSLGRGRPGRSGTRRALKLERTAEPPVRAQTYARLGRGELERARAFAGGAGGAGDGAPDLLRTIFVRVWAELGRTHRPLGAALELEPGAVVELDQPAHASVELFANGLCFANGKLVVTAEGAWGVEVQTLL